ncbi:MAG: rod shape-determining protein MreD [Ignavibacteria bacterium]|nr:rod shape-determining protein MreD [Ignavibacteria bacterium]
MKEYLKYAVILFLLVLIQKTLIWIFSVTEYSITPDIVLIGIVYTGINKGKIGGSLSGFITGLLIDLMSFSFIGLMALSKTTAGFISGFFMNENKIDKYLSGYVFVVACFICSFCSNFIYYFIYFQGSGLEITDIFLRYIIPTSFYTMIFSVIPVIFARKKMFRR